MANLIMNQYMFELSDSSGEIIDRVFVDATDVGEAIGDLGKYRNMAGCDITAIFLMVRLISPNSSPIYL